MFSLNVLTQFVNDKQGLLNWFLRAQPNVALVMDDIGFSRHIKSLLPNTTVIHRQWNQHDHEYHHKISPAEWVAAHVQFGQGGIVVQCLNEPQTYGDVSQLVKWCVEVMQLSASAGITLCLFNAAVGHPDSNNITNGAFDPLWRAFHRHPQHIYGCHEYAVFSTVDERPFRIGRFLDVIHRVKALGLNVPRIVVTETGRDVGGGENDGYKAVFNEQQYADFLGGLHDVYSAYNVDCCVFCYGVGGGQRWRSFDVEGAGTVLNRLIEYNQQSGSEGDMVFVRKPNVSYSLNMRSAPVIADNVNGSVGQNTPVRLLEANVTNGWIKILNGSIPGYVSLQTNLPFPQQVRVVAAA